MVKPVFDKIKDKKKNRLKDFIIITPFRVRRLAAVKMHYYEKEFN